MQFRRRGRIEVAINIAPLVDVVFLLVIFFAVTTTFLETAGLELELPESSSTAPRESKNLVVQLSAEGEVTVGGKKLETDDLTAWLRAEMEGDERKLVVLRADGRSRHADVVRIMDLIRDSGARSLTVAARASE